MFSDLDKTGAAELVAENNCVCVCVCVYVRVCVTEHDDGHRWSLTASGEH